MIILFIVISWLLVGAGGFIYWWTSDYDLTTSDLIPLFFSSTLGPLSWLVGFFIHGKSKGKTLINKRTP